MQHIQTAAVATVAIAQKRKVSPEKARDLEVPNRRAFQTIGEGRAGIRLERYRVRTDLNRFRFVLVIEFDCAEQVAIAHRTARIVEAHEGGDRDFRFGRYPAVRRAISLRFDLRRERGADAGFAVCVAKPAYLQVREGYELRQVISAVI